MAAISIGDAHQIVQYAVEIYNKIHDAEDEVKQAGVAMERLDNYLTWLLKLVKAKMAAVSALDTHWNELLERIKQRMKEIKHVSEKIATILQIYHDNGHLAKYLFPFGRNPKALRNLLEELKQYKKDLKDDISTGLLIHDSGLTVGSVAPSIPPPPPSPKTQSKAKPKPALLKDLGIVFVDPHNVGRGKVAEAYVKLLQPWTLRTGGHFPVKFAHSSGLRVKHRSNCAEAIEKLKPKSDMAAGKQPPCAVAMESLFDNKYFDYPYKAGIREQMTKSRSRGVNDTLFQTYDYIIVFVQREFTQLLELKKALVVTKGEQIAPKDKGKIVHLGAYVSKDGNPQSISDAKKGEDGQQSRAEWNKTTSQIKLAIKVFMKEELGWKQPPKGAAQS